MELAGLVGVAVEWCRESLRICREVERLTADPAFDITARYRVTLPDGESVIAITQQPLLVDYQDAQD